MDQIACKELKKYFKKSTRFMFSAIHRGDKGSLENTSKSWSPIRSYLPLICPLPKPALAFTQDTLSYNQTTVQKTLMVEKTFKDV